MGSQDQASSSHSQSYQITGTMDSQIALLLFTGAVCQALAAAQYQYPTTTTTTTTPTFPPRPFKYAFSSGRVPGGPPDRYTLSEGDANGVIRGGYAYLDPNQQWQKVEYVADENGFHVDSSALSHPKDTVAVAEAKANHHDLYDQIAIRNSIVPVVAPVVLNAETPAVAGHRDAFHVDTSALPVANPIWHPKDTVAVAEAKANHQNLYEQIAIRNSIVPVVAPVLSNVETPVVAGHRDAFHRQFDQIAAEHARIRAEHELLAEMEEKERELAKEQRLTYI